jgi:hypothetical protein
MIDKDVTITVGALANDSFSGKPEPSKILIEMPESHIVTTPGCGTL